jgi:phage baseplate assembly protein W
MATVNLNSLFQKPVNPNSAIKYIYQDFNVMSMETLYTNNIAARKVKTDLNVSYDVAAVKNSISNLLSTKKCEKILSPEYGLRIEDYLFEPVTSTTASAIANEILNAITIYEPRVQIVDLQVIPYPDQYLYVINLVLRIPTLKQSLSLQGTIQGDSITIL